MAGLEQLTIHSRSYLVRWIDVAAGHTISWSLQPHKRSINFGIFKHPGSPSGGVNPPPAFAPSSVDGSPTSNPEFNPIRNRHASLASTTPPTSAPRQDAAPALEKLQNLGMKSVAWTGRCEPDIVTMGHYDVPLGESGMYGLVFDNTHSKQLSKTVTFVLMTYPSTAPPKSGHQIHFKQAMSRKYSTGIAQTSPSLGPATESSENLPQAVKPTNLSLGESRQRAATGGSEPSVVADQTFYTGILLKKRRKRNQGWAKRFFSLDFTSSTLSYYKNRSAASLRGAIPLSLAAIGADEKSRHISVDSGAEIWLLRASNKKHFEGWCRALERACQHIATPVKETAQASAGRAAASGSLEPAKLAQIEPLVGRVAGITDAVRRLASDTAPKNADGLGISDAKDTPGSLSASPSLSENETKDYFTSKASTSPQRPAFWKRKSSSNSLQGAGPGTLRKSSAAQQSLAVPSHSHTSINVLKRPSHAASLGASEDVHGRCAAILKDLDAVVAQFSSLIAESRQLRQPERPPIVGRQSLESTYSQEFFDADDGMRQSQILQIHDDSEGEESPDRDGDSTDGDSTGGDSASTIDDIDDGAKSFTRQSLDDGEPVLVPRPHSLAPLPKEHVTRRKTIPPSSGAPPSLISFLRKNVGKDLSTIAMPVTANEPLSLLQRQAEQMEYSELLDAAVTASAESGERLLYITAFAISALSGSRLKERAVRKPFNPMLGETYELVREDKGFRFLAEKISHRPVRVACQGEAKEWTFLHAPSPSQKFWGKSAELTTEGRARVVLHATRECFSWNPATCFLRNIIAGEKYVEPVQNMTVLDEASGRKAIVTFKSGGVFSGRSEEVSVQAFDAHGTVLPLGLQGKWTSQLTLTSSSHGHAVGTGTEVWTAGALVKDATKRFGMTEFAASLNEITSLEEDGKALPPTDSRRRPDQRKYEQGEVDSAERLKAQLEEAQRRRRREMETSGEEWEPRWFEKAGREGLEDVWRLKGEEHGEDYWGVRAAVLGFKHGRWDGVREVFEL